MATDEKQYLSADKYSELEAELERLSTTERKEVANRLEVAKGFGDLKENSEYQEARASQARLEGRIVELTQLLRNAVIVDSHHSTKAEIGSTIKIQKSGSKEVQTIHLVGSSEANFKEGKISNASPIGKAMMGKKKDEKFSVQTAKGTANYKVVDIA